MIEEGLQLPQLPAPYDAALRACALQVFEQYEVLALLACGTIVAGNPDNNSDLDINVLHSGSFRERVQSFHEGVPCEIFVNPPHKILEYYDEGVKSRRPTMAHMFSTGHVVFDPQGIASDLVARAKLVLEHPPAPTEDDIVRAKYAAATSFEDAEDLFARDKESALLHLGAVTMELARCRIAIEPGWLPRGKDILSRLREVDGKAAELAVESLHGSPESRFHAAGKLCERVTGSAGFFEWTSEREPT